MFAFSKEGGTDTEPAASLSPVSIAIFQEAIRIFGQDGDELVLREALGTKPPALSYLYNSQLRS